MKFAAGAEVKTVPSGDRRIFTANLDTYHGNSGSLIANANTNEVEVRMLLQDRNGKGFLISGSRDYVPGDDDCCESNRCSNEDGIICCSISSAL